MDWWLILVVIFGALTVLMWLGVPVAFSFILVNFVAAYLLWGGMAGMRQIILSMETSIASFNLLPVPLFILMGEVLFRSGVGIHAIDVLDKWMGRMPGRLSVLAIGAGTLFSALSGMSMASAVLLGSILVPDMEKRGYSKTMSLGPVMAGGGLAILIPPSGLAIILCWLANISIGAFIVAMVIPGLLVAAVYAIYIIVRCKLQPEVAPSYDVKPSSTGEKLSLTVRYVLPLFLVIFMVTGIIFIGVATPTEAAATGALASVLLAIAYTGFNKKMLMDSFMSTIELSCMVLMILTGSQAFSQILAFSGAAGSLTQVTLSLNIFPIGIFIMMQLIVLILGCFMDQVAIMMITMPIFLPIISALNFNPIWFGIILLLNLEVATLSPPFGMTLFAVKGVASKDTTMGDVYRAAYPFIALDILVMAIMILFPIITTWLPGLMMAGR